MSPENNADFDYIVVGSGPGGGPLAANLARLGHRVLLLEAGGRPTSPHDPYDVPAFQPKAAEDPELSWTYYVRHFAKDAVQKADWRFAHERDRGILYPRSGTLGGCTAHYAMIVVAAHDGDWDAIARDLPDPSWSAACMRTYFDRVVLSDPIHAQWVRTLSGAIASHAGLAAAMSGARPDLWQGLLGAVDRSLGADFRGWLPLTAPDVRLALRDPMVLDVITAAWIQAATARIGVGGLMNPTLDPNDPDAGVSTGREGLVIVPTATDGIRRRGTREYIEEVTRTHPDNLQVMTGALVTKVLLDGQSWPRAMGVEVIQGGGPFYGASALHPTSERPTRATTIGCRREVILAAGTFNTPQLLMLSGIGSDDVLGPKGIKGRVRLEGVGKNLQDRYEIAVISELDRPFALLEDVTFDASANDAGYTDWRRGRGVYTTNGALIGLVKRSMRAAAKHLDPDLFMFAAPGYFDGYYTGWSNDSLGLDPIVRAKRATPYLTWILLKAHTSNDKGRVTLRSSDPYEPPLVDFANFQNDPGGDDLAALVEGIEFARSINRRLGWAREIRPGPEEPLPDFVRANAWGHHASGTCKMGPESDTAAVVDGRFCVHGVRGLRVVDASVFPRIPGFFIAAPTLMLSEKAADVIHEDARRS